MLRICLPALCLLAAASITTPTSADPLPSNTSIHQANASARALGRILRDTRTVKTGAPKLGTTLKGGVGES